MHQAGWSKAEIGIAPRGYAMHGYGQPSHRGNGQQMPLFARAVFLRDGGGRTLVFCCLDLGYVTHALRAAAVAGLGDLMGADFNDAAFVLTCTHTHSGPGGCSHDVLYNLVTPGFQPAHHNAVVAAIVTAVGDAWRQAVPVTLSHTAGRFHDDVPVAWNRALRAWNRNPEVTRYREGENHLALDREMHLLRFRPEAGPDALISLFGVHATCLGNTLDRHDGDNKGRAARQTETALGDGAVAIFAQGTAGDVSPHYHGPGQAARRAALRGEAEYAYAEANAQHQHTLAMALASSDAQQPVCGDIDAVLSYVDFTDLAPDAAFTAGHDDARTSEPCHGVSFFAGTPVDGRGVPPLLAATMRTAARALRRWRLGSLSGLSPAERDHYRRLHAAQGSKDILIEGGRQLALGRPLARLGLPDAVDPLVAEINRQARAGGLGRSALVPTVLPVQIVVIGTLALLCCPGEFTTTAGRRLLLSTQERLRARGVTTTLICTYCNDYMGYVTTREEYAAQTYEGGHTVFGQWTLAAFQTAYARLGEALCLPEAERPHDRHTRPTPAPADELAARSALPPRP